MLEHLYIQNFILIDRLELDFPMGFSAITGETGAGKSIFLDALSLLQGQKASSTMVSKDKAIIEASFSLDSKSPIASFLQENGFDIEEDSFTITREIAASGKSSARVNHRVVPLSFLHTLVESQLDIHGQKDSAYLLQKTRHLYLLDEYGRLHAQKKAVKEAYENYKQALKEKEDFLNTKLGEEELDFYQFQLQELEEANLQQGEEEKLKQLEKQAKEMKKSAQDYLSLFEYYDSESSNSLYQTMKLVDVLKGVDESQEKIHEAYETLVDGLEEIRDQLNPDFFDEEEMNQIEERLFLIQRFKRKYGPRLEDVLHYQKDLAEKLANYGEQEFHLKKLDEKINFYFKEYSSKANHLSEKRHQIAKSLEKEVLQQLKDLELPYAQFEVLFKDIEGNSTGIDDVEFYVSMNKGEKLSSLTKVASGGELSRFMLALKIIFTKLQGIQTIVFDEIDTGVSGHVATAIGEKMALLSKDCQVFSVTHLAQVASLAHHQFLVSKSVHQEKTTTKVHLLNQEERASELAYLFSGNRSEKAIEAAKELLEHV
ncbi:DNA repair protein RecN [Bulleidia sp. zg-1006]|uniref:DNA repair protein RecN n=1 Tax=Bulleidia sp. zg-1006 TaxID=2806552 RepID=UPI00193A743E|nr:DNA repair protein RecN [Bulleidia sp. zg-1006]QRG87388.1 DNA repair protein RecN [Bulleidia sp. zg-1006]